MHIHYIQHVPFEGIGIIDHWITENKYTKSGTKLYETTHSFPSMDEFDGLVVMGGPMNIYDHDEHPWLPQEKAFILQAIEAKKKIIGICLGAQLIADLLGAEITANPHKEIGFFPVSLTAEAATIDFLSQLPQTFTTMHWHGDTFSLPKGATHIFENDTCKNQGFLYQKHVLGLQFHMETTANSLEDLLTNCEHELKEESPFIQSEEEIKKHVTNLEDNQRYMLSLLNSFFYSSFEE
ncbi:MAG: type 1 glutamine amidotransferase [Cyclobacteriaceae bacterium]